MGQKSYVSDVHRVIKANGNSTNVTINKKRYFQISIMPNSMAQRNNLGNIWITNAHRMNNYKNVTYQDEFKIFSIDLKSNGTYNYWTTDIANDGQTVLFQINMNSAIAKITMSRYAPGAGSTVLKKIVYSLE
jgi:hypothetical protein